MRIRQLIDVFALSLLSLCSTVAMAQEQWIVTGADVAQALQSQSVVDSVDFSVGTGVQGRSALTADEAVQFRIGAHVHYEHGRCGGYMLFDNEEAALAEISNPFYDAAYLSRAGLFPTDVHQQTVVGPALDAVEASEIVDTIQMLQDFGTRHYQQQGGVDAAKKLRDLWASFGSGSGYSVELYSHSWLQPSVVATIEGSDKPEEVIVLGGHLDSINLANFSDAPGADDNASGIAVVTEVLRVLLNQNYKPEKTLKFIAYAAEEVGLRGSRAIAADYKSDPNMSIEAALQFDMTGHGGSPKDMYLITDYVSTGLTQFLELLLNEYNAGGSHAISFGTTACGYACSDHAAWTSEGIPSAFPFESLFADAHSHIHSSSDILSNIDASGIKQAKFAKLGLEFAIELSSPAQTPNPIPEARNNAYAWANDPNSATYTPSSTYSYNSAGGPVTAERISTGDYRMRFANLGRTQAGGQVQVTGYGHSNNECKVRSWSSLGDDVVVRVGCMSPSGALVDQRYTVYFEWP